MKKMTIFIVCAMVVLVSRAAFSSTDLDWIRSFTAPVASSPVCINLSGERLFDKDVIRSRIEEEFGKLGREAIYKSSSIIINLRANYIQDDGVGVLVAFLTSPGLFSVIKDKLTEIDISNNRFTKAGLGSLKDLLGAYPSLKINAAINSFDYADFVEAFKDPTSVSARSRLRITPY